jgi:hypothetical protein
MKPTLPLLTATLVLGAATVGAQEPNSALVPKPWFDRSAAASYRMTPGNGTLFASALRQRASSTGSPSLRHMVEAGRFELHLGHKTAKRDVDWIGLLTEQTRVDGIMHLFRMTTEPGTRARVASGPFVKGYLDAVQGYFEGTARWEDGDPFYGNNINHPLMGAVSSHTYTNHDRRCKGVMYGDAGYWACIRRATIFSFAASLSWEWNPLMSESALGGVGRFHECQRGSCTGDGGWSDFVMTPLGGLGIRVAGDIARARLWPVLDRNLSGNVAAKIVKNVIKVATAPGYLANCAFNGNFENALSSRPAMGRR